jgi:uncharacterized protein
MLQGLEPSDHGLDARAHLLVLVHECGTLAGERLVTHPQRAVLIPEVFQNGDQLLDPFCQPRYLMFQLCSCSVAHVLTIEPPRLYGQLYNQPVMIHPGYRQVQTLLTQERSLADAAEAHGTLSGCLCAAAGYRFEDWLREILPEGRAAPAAAGALQELYASTAAALLQPDMEFDLLLPADDERLNERTEALAQWCQGFLYGLGAGAIPDASELGGDVGEIVRDLLEISHAGAGPEQDEEANESAYAELVEFVRVGVQLLFEELASARGVGRPAPAALH